MIPFYIGLGISLLVLGFGIAWLYVSDLFTDGPAIFTTFVGALATLLFGIIVLVTGLSRHYGRIACEQWGKQTGRPARFVIYTRLDTGSCLTMAPDGRWVTKDAVIFNIPATFTPPKPR